MNSAISENQPAAKRTLATTGVMMVIFMFAIDATIVATSMPTIVARLGGLELYSWVFSIYMLTSALMTPIFGKLADLYSKRRLTLIGIAVFLLGSLLCGAAINMEMLIAARALQGLGGGAVYALAFIVVGVLYPADQRAKMQGIISGIWGLASIIGPLAGGVIVENWHWRWIFFVNLPLIALATTLIVVGLKDDRRGEHRAVLDLKGALTLLVGLLLIFYALGQSAHSQRALSFESIGLIGAGVCFLVLFVVIERRAAEPIMPLQLFRIDLYKSSTAVATLCSMGVFGAISYLPLYLQGVVGFAASRAGLVILVLSLGWTAGSLLAGRWINQYGYRAVAIAGMSLLAFGYLLFVAPFVGNATVAVVISAITIGCGMGLANLTTLVAAQTSVPHQRIGVATSTVMLFRTFGGAFAVSLLGTIMLGQMRRGLAQLNPAQTGLSAELLDKLANPQNLLEPATRAQIAPTLLGQLIPVLGHAIWYAFLAGLVLMVVGVVAACFMDNYTPATTPRTSDRDG